MCFEDSYSEAVYGLYALKGASRLSHDGNQWFPDWNQLRVPEVEYGHNGTVAGSPTDFEIARFRRNCNFLWGITAQILQPLAVNFIVILKTKY